MMVVVVVVFRRSLNNSDRHDDRVALSVASGLDGLSIKVAASGYGVGVRVRVRTGARLAVRISGLQAVAVDELRLSYHRVASGRLVRSRDYWRLRLPVACVKQVFQLWPTVYFVLFPLVHA